MKIIITAGGTTERIDPVRKITNTATGKLGSLTAEAFVKQCKGRTDTIYYVCQEGTVIPDLPCVKVIPAKSAEAVKSALSDILTTQKIDAVVHSMAVSDYMVESVTTAENLSEYIAHRLLANGAHPFADESGLAGQIAASIRENDRLLDRNTKIGSDNEKLILTMRRTPKIIGMIKALQPSAVLVGFKLLNGVGEQHLLETGYKLLVRNSCDFVLANDLQNIRDGRHRGLLISQDGSHTTFETKEEIAGAIVRAVLDKLDGKADQI